jgi:GxxExxY protein
MYENIKIDAGYRLDLRVADLVIVEVKSVERIQPIHKAQLLSYLRLSGLRVGLLINFNVTHLTEGIKRMIL